MHWIKIRTNLIDDPAVYDMSDKLQVTRHQIVGQLSDVWAWIGDNTSDGVAPNITPSTIDARVSCPGFAAAMAANDWLTILQKGVAIPKWDRHNSNNAKVRSLEAEAKRARRELQKTGSKNTSDNCPTKKAGNVRPEKRREEKSTSAHQQADAPCQQADTTSAHGHDTPPPAQGDLHLEGGSSSVEKKEDGGDSSVPRKPRQRAAPKPDVASGPKVTPALKDALVAALGWDHQSVTSTAWSEVQGALRQILDVEPALDGPLLAQAVARYREAWPNLTITPSALAKFWHQFRPERQQAAAAPTGRYAHPPCEHWQHWVNTHLGWEIDLDTPWPPVPMNRKKQILDAYAAGTPTTTTTNPPTP